METSPPDGIVAGTNESSPATSSVQKPTRSRKGCFSCRRRKVKCDEIPPQCRNCRIGDRQVNPLIQIDIMKIADDSVIGPHRKKYQRIENGDRLQQLITSTTMGAGEAVSQVSSISSNIPMVQMIMIQSRFPKLDHRR